MTTNFFIAPPRTTNPNPLHIIGTLYALVGAEASGQLNHRCCQRGFKPGKEGCPQCDAYTRALDLAHELSEEFGLDYNESMLWEHEGHWPHRLGGGCLASPGCELDDPTPPETTTLY